MPSLLKKFFSLLWICAALFCAGSVHAQVPAISSFNPVSGPVGTNVILTGSNFSPVASNNLVWFGPVSGTVISASTNQLIVTVPTNAAQASITVTVNGLIGSALTPFKVTYLGGALSSSSLAPAIHPSTGANPVGIKIVDLDGDGKPDLVVANISENTVSVYRNISTNGTLALGSFAPRVSFATEASPIFLDVGDMDGDGQPDVIVTYNAASAISIFRNVSSSGTFTTNSFAPRVNLPTGIQPIYAVAVDLNLDGKLDLAVANYTDNTVSILRNVGSAGSLTTNSFARKIDFPTEPNPTGLAVADFDGDGQSDLAVSHDANTISIFRNTTVKGSPEITFAARVGFITPARPLKLAAGDLDGDGRPDLAVAIYNAAAVSVFRNTATVGVINSNSFASRIDLALAGPGHTVSIVDIDGDAKSEIVAVSEVSNTLGIFRNMSTPGALTNVSFASRVDFGAATDPQALAVGDLDGDGRPDVVTSDTFANVLSIFRNVNSALPSITLQPQSSTVLAGTNLALSVTAAGVQPLSYQWLKDGTNVNLPGATNASLILSNAQPSQSGNYMVIVTNVFGSVTSTPAIVKIRFLYPQGNSQRLTNAQYSYFTSVNISFEKSFTNGMVFYTLDGTTPTFASSNYTAPFVLNRSAVLRAIVYSADFSQSGESDPVIITIIPPYTLTTVTAGGGTIARSGSNPYPSNTVVNLTASPASGWTFLQWLGDATGTNPVTTVNMTRNKSVRAVFGTALNTTVAGSGSVTLDPASSLYPYGTIVRLTAIPQAGSYFGIWGNAASGNTNPLDFVVINPNPTISSLFSTLSAGQYALTVSPNGLGRVSVNPRANVYNSGQSVTLTATPDAGQTFLGWSGDATDVVNPLSVLMNQSRFITANFSKNPRMAIQYSSSTFNSEGFQIVLTGPIGEIYSLQSSSNLLDWSAVTTLTNSYGTVQFTDFPKTNSNQQYYRATQP